MGLVQGDPLIPVPEKILNQKPRNSNQLEKYRKDYIRTVSPQGIHQTVQGLMKMVQRGNVTAIKLAAEMFGLVQGNRGAGVSVNVQQNSATVVSGDTDGREKMNFDTIVRLRAERKKIAMLPAPDPQQTTFVASAEEIFD